MQTHHPTLYMIFGLINTVGPELGEDGAGLGYCVSPSGVIRGFGQWDCKGLSTEADKCDQWYHEGPRGMAMESG